MNIVRNTIIILFFAVVLMLSALRAAAFSLDTYTTSSVLADGRWVKVSVAETGMHFLSAVSLRKMGFDDPARVRVYGYGAMRLPDKLERSTYIDDLPLVQSVNTSDGVYFYAVGPVSFPTVNDNRRSLAINPFTTLGYYYITDSDVSLRDIPVGMPVVGEVVDNYTETLYHKREIYSPGETGHTLLGEDFQSQRTQVFTFDMPGRVEGTSMWLECDFWANSTQSSRVVLSVNDNALTYSSSDNIAGNDDHYRHGKCANTVKSCEVDGEKARVSVTYSPTGTVTMARLNYLIVNYKRYLQLNSGVAKFNLGSCGGILSGASVSTTVWDVTDPLDIKTVEGVLDGAKMRFYPVANGIRDYVAWDKNAKLPSPVFVSQITSQNLHAEPVPDMVIFTHSDWKSQADRVATLHREGADSLRVLVVDQQQVYNEFSSGSPDANALRKLLKMFWDRSTESTRRLRYALIMGRSTYDNRRITSVIASLNYPTLPCWQTDNSDFDNTSYTTDDIYAMLGDGAGGNTKASDYNCIAVGRMPVVSLQDARNVVDKLYSYVNTPINTGWKNRVLLVADDENEGVFMEDTESMIDNSFKRPGAERMVFDKIYIDAYEKQNSTYPGARSDMFRLLTEGVVWWNFAGHANPSSWTGDGLMTYTDINNLYLKHYPFVVAVTCDFLRWDATTISAAEILYRTESSGIIGAISATRPALIGPNGDFMRNMGYHMFGLDDDGRNLTIGEVFRRTKNGSAGNETWSNDNKLRYVLMGDPALRLCIPNNTVRLESIDGVVPDLELQPTIKAGQDVVLEGSVVDNNGGILADFNGKLYVTLYDAEYSVTSHGYGDTGKEVTFENKGKRLQIMVDSVSQGRFKVNFIMPSEVSNNFRPATLNMYAVDDDGRDASGVNSNFYVYGFDEDAVSDTVPPVIDAFYLNHSSFASGDVVNNTPVVIARITDNRSINLSSAGIGHQMLLSIDGRSLTDTPLYYTPYSDGTPGGTLVYKLDYLSKGRHDLRLRVWDTAGNSSTSMFEFNVADDFAPSVFDIYADTNPASTDTRFYLTTDCPDSRVTVNIEVFNMLGRPVWSTSVTGMNETLRTFPVQWNLTDNNGHRVPRGIYLYRASVTNSEGLTSPTKVRRLAVSAR